jgi:hypothetical protein
VTRAMSDTLGFLAALAVWILVQHWLLPRLGVRT